MTAYKFSNTAVKTKPDTKVTRFVERVQSGTKLTREDKNAIVNLCYGTLGSQFAGLKYLGWKWSLTSVLNEYIVEFTYGRYESFFAPDKTSLRKTFKGIRRIIAVK